MSEKEFKAGEEQERRDAAARADTGNDLYQARCASRYAFKSTFQGALDIRCRRRAGHEGNHYSYAPDGIHRFEWNDDHASVHVEASRCSDVKDFGMTWASMIRCEQDEGHPGTHTARTSGHEFEWDAGLIRVNVINVAQEVASAVQEQLDLDKITDTHTEINTRFNHHPPTEEQQALYQELRLRFRTLAQYMVAVMPDGRETELAMTALEQASMWANAGIARRT